MNMGMQNDIDLCTLVTEDKNMDFFALKSNSSITTLNNKRKKQSHSRSSKRIRKGIAKMTDQIKKEKERKVKVKLTDGKLTSEVKEIFKSQNIQTNSIKSLNKEKKMNDTIVAGMSFVMIIIALVQLYILIDDSYDMMAGTLTLRTCILILSVPNLFFIYRRYSINLEIRKITLKIKESTLWSSGLYKVLIIEILINVLQPFPYVEQTVELLQGQKSVSLSLSHFFTLLMIIRIYLTCKLLNHYSLWTNSRSKRIGVLQGINTNSFFALKVLFKNSPLFLLGFISLAFLVILGLLIRVFEFSNVDDEKNPYRFFWNAVWLTFVTMSTVGYGDYTPSTNFGKVFCILACLMGIFLLSMLVAVLTLYVFIDGDEKRAYQKLIEKDIIYHEMSNEISEVFKILGLIYKNISHKNYLTSSPNCELNQNYTHTVTPTRTHIHTQNTKCSNDELRLLRLLLKTKLKKLNHKKKLINIKDVEEIEHVLIDFDKQLDIEDSECSNNTLKIIHCQKKLYSIAKIHPKIYEMAYDIKDYANRITNIANFMRVLHTGGILKDIFSVEGGRLFSQKEIEVYHNGLYYNELYNKKLLGIKECSRIKKDRPLKSLRTAVM